MDASLQSYISRQSTEDLRGVLVGYQRIGQLQEIEIMIVKMICQTLYSRDPTIPLPLPPSEFQSI